MKTHNITDSTHELRFFMDEKLLRSVSIEPGIQAYRKLMKEIDTVGYTAFLPDYTPANSLPIGTSFLLDSSKRLNPAWIGIDIGCGYNLFQLDIDLKKVLKKGKLNACRLQNIVCAIDSVLLNWSDQKYTNISLPIQDIQKSAEKYLGTLGHGNHFIDLFYIDNIIDKKCFRKCKLDPGKLFILIHSGSREMGFKIHSHFAINYKKMDNTEDFNEYYLKGIQTANDYAVANRQKLMKDIVTKLGCSYTEIFDQNHNTIDRCAYDQKSLFRIRKGATLIQNDQLSIIPGNCTSQAYLVNSGEKIADTYHTIPHGTGRKYTRAQLFSKFARSKKLDDLFKTVELNVSPKKMIEELPVGYKSIDDVIKAVTDFKLAKPVASLSPLAVIVDRK